MEPALALDYLMEEFIRKLCKKITLYYDKRATKILMNQVPEPDQSYWIPYGQDRIFEVVNPRWVNRWLEYDVPGKHGQNQHHYMSGIGSL